MPHPRNAVLAAALLAFAGILTSAQIATAAPAPKTDLDTKSGTLSDKLGDTNGVIKPTGNVDPGMRKPTPRTGTMPVIKPRTITPGTAK